jgi:predicted nucleotidyltransferase
MNIDDIKDYIIFEAIAGSQAYGTNTPQSDIDIRGIFVLPLRERLSLVNKVEEVGDDKQDTKYYELEKFMLLAAQCNPNIAEMLFLPQDCIQICTPVMQEIINNRNLFISKRAFNTFFGYSVAQIKKAKGRNKYVNCPQPETPPTKEDFCWILDNSWEGHLWDMPARPRRFKDCDSSIDLAEYNAAALEHIANTYRLYYYGSRAKGVFRGDETIVCENIPMEDEREKYRFLMIYNKDAYDQALKQWHSYWDWKNNRNEARWVDQEKGLLNYDQKNMMHCMRLLWSGENILKSGEPIVRFEGEKLQYLRDIRAGKFSYETIMAEVEKKMGELKEIANNSTLPDKADIKKIDKLYYELITR